MKAKRAPEAWPLSMAQSQLLLAAVAFVALPHVFNLHLVICGFFGCCVAWRWAELRHPRLHPTKAALFLITILGGALVFLVYHRFYGREPGAALFMVGLGLKLLEMHGKRDVFLVIFLAFFVALTQYLFSQSIPMALYTLIAVALSVAVLIAMTGGQDWPVRVAMRQSAAMVGQALPIMAVLFVFFPRVHGPLWGLPEEDRSGRTGLSDTIEPGAVSRLGSSYQTAFRVDFEGARPPPSQLYWRGPVFWRTDGRAWTLPPREQPLDRARKPEFRGPGVAYTITLEPHHRTWVFALDLPAEFPAELKETADYRLLSADKVEERRQYRLVSHTGYRTGPLSSQERQAGLQLHGTPTERVRDLVADWKSAAADDANRVVEQALGYFREQPFVYTLSPPATEGDPVDSFLFDTRRGFCEHYASAFVYLMRVAGIPSRIVAGYQGGQWNKLGGFLEVRQADAHAWAEVWLPGRGWVRIDPTAAVAPERVENGIDADQQAGAADVVFNAAGNAIGSRARNLRYWLGQGRQVWASVDHAWTRWVLSYDPESQKQLWSSLGIEDWLHLALWLGGLLTVGAAAALLLFVPRRRIDPALRAYQGFLTKLGRHGIIRQPGEGPADFGRRAATERPEAAALIGEITGHFVRLRYGVGAGPNELARLRRAVRALRI